MCTLAEKYNLSYKYHYSKRFFHQCFVCLLLGSISRDIFICSLGLSITFRALQRKKNTRLKLSPVSSEHPTHLWLWSSLGIRLFLIQRTSRLKWVSKVPWGTSLVPWLLPSSSSIVYVTKTDGKELGNETMKNVTSLVHKTKMQRVAI